MKKRATPTRTQGLGRSAQTSQSHPPILNFHSSERSVERRVDDDHRAPALSGWSGVICIVHAARETKRVEMKARRGLSLTLPIDIFVWP